MRAPCAPSHARAPLEFMAEVLESFSLKKYCTEAFQNALSNERGTLTKEDYKVAIVDLLGYKPSKYELDSVWTECVGCHDKEEAEGMDEVTFTALMTKRLVQKDIDEWIRQMFVSFDVHLNGFITLESCRRVFHEIAPLIKPSQIEKWFQVVDIDSDGRVTFRDFELMVKSHTLLLSSQ